MTETAAEHFRDVAHRDVLLLIDNIFRFVQCGTEVSGLLGDFRRRRREAITAGLLDVVSGCEALQRNRAGGAAF